MKKGFTIIELLIVVGITVLVSAAALPIYGNLQSSAQLNEASAQITQTIRNARERSLAGYNNAPHGVKFLSDRYILYQGLSYDLRESAYDYEVVLDNPLSLLTTLVGDEIVFSRRLAEPDNVGTVTISHNVYGNQIISINELGLVEEE